MNLLDVSNISLSFADKNLFSDLSFTIGPKDRLAVLGINGSGKSTLLAVLAEREKVDSGLIRRQKNLTMSLLLQSPNWAMKQ